MSLPRLFFAIALLGAVALPSFAQTEPATAPGVAEIRKASTPSEVIAAYGVVVGTEGPSVPVEQAYLHKMVDMGLPEMAEAQASDLTRRAPTDGLPWAVAAFMSARNDRNDAALIQIGVAVQNAPEDPFVARTAGQITAWYDTRPVEQLSALSDAAKQSLEGFRWRVRQLPMYIDAYRDAREEIDHAREAMATTQPTTQPEREANAVPYDQGMPYTLPYVYGDNPMYTSPYVYSNYGAGYAPWWPSAYSYGFPYFGFGGSFIIVNHNHFFDHKHGFAPPFKHGNFFPHQGSFGFNSSPGFRGGTNFGINHNFIGASGFRNSPFNGRPFGPSPRFMGPGIGGGFGGSPAFGNRGFGPGIGGGMNGGFRGGGMGGGGMRGGGGGARGR
ncbi:MAG TPA: hypothetical protein VH518_06840 [Tepidisphaeraceae bacterium]|jgi:hypothetical protein